MRLFRRHRHAWSHWAIHDTGWLFRQRSCASCPAVEVRSLAPRSLVDYWGRP